MLGMKMVGSGIGSLLVALLIAPVAEALPDHTAAFLRLGPETAPPQGFQQFCHADPTSVLCLPPEKAIPFHTRANRSTSNAMSRTSSDPDPLSLLRRVNRRVNARVGQQSDERVYGVGEHWQRSGIGRNARGDCEDIAIEKRLLLLEEGFSPKKLAFAVVYSRASGLHTVLIARTDRGDVVLDSRTPYVEPWSRTTYSWVSIQSMNDPLAWGALAAA